MTNKTLLNKSCNNISWLEFNKNEFRIYWDSYNYRLDYVDSSFATMH